jgi:hypothetical protein
VATVDQVDALADAIRPRWRLTVYIAAYRPARPEEQAEVRRPDVSMSLGYGLLAVFGAFRAGGGQVVQ